MQKKNKNFCVNNKNFSQSSLNETMLSYEPIAGSVSIFLSSTNYSDTESEKKNVVLQHQKKKKNDLKLQLNKALDSYKLHKNNSSDFLSSKNYSDTETEERKIVLRRPKHNFYNSKLQLKKTIITNTDVDKKNLNLICFKENSVDESQIHANLDASNIIHLEKNEECFNAAFCNNLKKPYVKKNIKKLDVDESAEIQNNLNEKKQNKQKLNVNNREIINSNFLTSTDQKLINIKNTNCYFNECNKIKKNEELQLNDNNKFVIKKKRTRNSKEKYYQHKIANYYRTTVRKKKIDNKQGIYDSDNQYKMPASECRNCFPTTSKPVKISRKCKRNILSINSEFATYSTPVILDYCESNNLIKNTEIALNTNFEKNNRQQSNSRNQIFSSNLQTLPLNLNEKHNVQNLSTINSSIIAISQVSSSQKPQIVDLNLLPESEKIEKNFDQNFLIQNDQKVVFNNVLKNKNHKKKQNIAKVINIDENLNKTQCQIENKKTMSHFCNVKKEINEINKHTDFNKENVNFNKKKVNLKDNNNFEDTDIDEVIQENTENLKAKNEAKQLFSVMTNSHENLVFNDEPEIYARFVINVIVEARNCGCLEYVRQIQRKLDILLPELHGRKYTTPNDKNNNDNKVSKSEYKTFRQLPLTFTNQKIFKKGCLTLCRNMIIRLRQIRFYSSKTYNKKIKEIEKMIKETKMALKLFKTSNDYLSTRQHTNVENIKIGKLQRVVKIIKNIF